VKKKFDMKPSGIISQLSIIKLFGGFKCSCWNDEGHITAIQQCVSWKFSEECLFLW
jgi:hypothetical protein